MSNVPRESAIPDHIITMYATGWCGDCRRAKRWFDAHGISYNYINIDRDEQAAAYVLRINGGMRSVPTIVFPDGSVLVEPSNRELAQQIAIAAASAPTLEIARAGTHDRPPEPRVSSGPPNLEAPAARKDSGGSLLPPRSTTIGTDVGDAATVGEISYPRFAALYNRLMGHPLLRLFFDPLRHWTAGQARGIVLEVGAGGGQNFPFYDPGRVVRVEAIEPDEAMLVAARRKQRAAPVSIGLARAAVEALPFRAAHFDSAVVSLVFCSVQEPVRGLGEIWRVLKPGGSVFFLEHVRAPGSIAAAVQDALVPVTTRCLANCHWNRDTVHMILEAGFQITDIRPVIGGPLPVLCIHATRPETFQLMLPE